MPDHYGSPATFQSRLKAHTASLHVQTEAHLLAPEITTGRLTGAQYKAMLQCHAVFHHALEGQIGQAAGFPAEYGFESRRKLPVLLADLQRLGVAIPVQMPALFAGWDVPHLVGACYVAEGATLGGNVIRRYLAANPAVAPLLGDVSYYGVYGEQTGARWRAFCLFLEGYAPGHEAALLEGAAGAFEIYLGFKLREE